MQELALLYVRVSSKEQEKEGYSLDAQEKLGYKYAFRNNIKIVKLWKVSESAWRKQRKVFNLMVDYAKKHSEIKHIIFDVTDRMTRNDFDKLKIYTLIKEHDKTIHFSRTNKRFNKNSNSDDEFMFDIEVAVAKKMSNDISRKARMGLREKAEQGFYPSLAPIGYKNNSTTHLIYLDEEKAPYIKRAFSLMATGSYSLSMLADKLYREGFRSRNGGCTKKCGIGLILKNPIYYGAFRWSGGFYQGSHAPIVSKGLFDQVQSVMNGKFRSSIQKKNFAFNNLITCGICNCKILGERKKNRYTYYHCTFSKGRHDGIGYVREEKLAIMFEDPIKKITIDEELAAWLIKDIKERTKGTLKLQKNRIMSLKTQYEKVSNRLSVLYDAKFDGEIDEGIFEQKEREYKTQLIEIKSEIDNSNGINPNCYEDAQKILELSKRLYSLYIRANYEEKVKILRFVASNYTLLNISLYPTYRKPFDILAKGHDRITERGRRDSNSRPLA